MKTISILIFAFLISVFQATSGDMSDDELYGEITLNLVRGESQFDVSEIGLITPSKYKRLSWKGNNLVINVLEIVHQDTTVSTIMLIKTRSEISFNPDQSIKSLIITVTDLTQNVMETEGNLQMLTFNMLPSIVFAKSIRARAKTKELVMEKQFEYQSPYGKKIFYTIDASNISKSRSFVVKIVVN